MSAVPDTRCGFEMLASSAMPEYTPLPDSLPNATETYHSAVCCRETVAGGDRCIWHADVSGKPRKDFPEVNQDKPVVLDGANLSGADLGEKSLTDVQMRFADLSGVDFEDADLSGSDLLAADLSEADLLNADFLDTDLPSANLSGAHLRDAEFSDADFTDSNLRNAQARGPTSMQLRSNALTSRRPTSSALTLLKLNSTVQFSRIFVWTTTHSLETTTRTRMTIVRKQRGHFGRLNKSPETARSQSR